MKAMLLAAGLGTRLKPWTDHHPKALAILNGKSLIQRNIEYLQQAGILDVLVNIHHFPDQLLEAIEKNKGWGSKISISDETAEVLETGGGLKKAEPYFEAEEDFLLMNVDILTDMPLTDFIHTHKAKRNLATLAVSKRKSSRYFLFDEQTGLLSGWGNDQTGEQKISREVVLPLKRAFSGIHCINTAIFPYITKTGKFSIVDVYLTLSASHPIGYYDHSGSKFMDVGKPENLDLAAEIFH